jgi:L-aminopeptidase/D-esterase-like protein
MPVENDTITRVSGVRIGHHTNNEDVTGCTAVLLPPGGARCVVDVRGGAPGTRETALLAEGSAAHIHAILLGGGSAFGLAAADGVMRWLAERDTGLATAAGVVPIVPAAIIYDLTTGNSVAPTAEMGYAAADAASVAPVACGSVGAGAGATVGKLHGRAFAMKGGIGSTAAVVRLGTGECTVGVVVVVNAVGDVWDVQRNIIVAGARDERGWLNGRSDPIYGRDAGPQPGTNTTIGVIATDAPISRHCLMRMVIGGHDGLARAIRPAHTVADGDTLFAMTTAPDVRPMETIDVIRIATAAEQLMETAIVRAVQAADARGGLPAARDLPPYL